MEPQPIPILGEHLMASDNRPAQVPSLNRLTPSQLLAACTAMLLLSCPVSAARFALARGA
jgi:hypothetical protein